MRFDWMKIVQRFRTRPPLSSRHDGRYGTPGHPSGGRTDGFPVIWCPISSSLATSTNVVLTLVVYQWQVGTFE